MKKIYTLLLAAGLLSSCGSGPSSSSKSDTTAIDTSTEKGTQASDKEKPAESKTKWTYTEDVDKMTSKKKYFARIESDNELNFEFPYDGGSKGGITIRNQNKTNEVMLSISKGQFHTSTDGTTIAVRFDDDTAINFDCSEASDSSSDLLFINSSKKFINKLKKSKKMKIQAEFYESGNQVLEFETAGLVWAH